MKDILKDKKKQKDLDFENVLEKIQGRNRSERSRNSVVSRGLYNTILRNSSTEKHSNSPKLSQEEKILEQKEIHEMLNKAAIVEP